MNEEEKDLSGVPDAIKDLIGEAESAKRDDDDGYPIVFMPEGTTKLRMYIDPSGKFCRMLYRYLIHNVMGEDGKPRSIYLPYVENNPIEKYQQELESLGYGSAWKYAPSQHYICYAWLISAEDKGDAVKLNQLVTLEMKWKVWNEVMACIRDFNPQVVCDMFDPTKEMNVWSVNYARGKGGNVSVSGDMSLKATIDPLPEDALPLSECWIVEGATQDSKDVALVVDHMKKLIKSIGSSKEPDSSNAGSTSAPTTPPEDPPKESPPEDTPKNDDTPPPSTEGVCPSAEKGFKWGEPQMDPECVLCASSKDCKAAASK